MASKPAAMRRVLVYLSFLAGSGLIKIAEEVYKFYGLAKEEIKIVKNKKVQNLIEG